MSVDLALRDFVISWTMDVVHLFECGDSVKEVDNILVWGSSPEKELLVVGPVRFSMSLCDQMNDSCDNCPYLVVFGKPCWGLSWLNWRREPNLANSLVVLEELYLLLRKRSN